MRFQIPDSDIEVDIPNEWWAFAEMPTFRVEHKSYTPPIQFFTDQIDGGIVAIAEIRPPVERSPEARVVRKERIVPILFGLRSKNGALPPVVLEALEAPNRYKYRLQHGYHRYVASVAAGYTHIPATFHEIGWRRPGERPAQFQTEVRVNMRRPARRQQPF